MSDLPAPSCRPTRARTSPSSAARARGSRRRRPRYLDSSPASPSSGSATATPLRSPPRAQQLDRLWHMSNLYWTEPMAELAARLSGRFGGAQAFFCNSGAEAIEAALKYARKATARPASSRSRARSTAARSARSRPPASRPSRRLRAARPGRDASCRLNDIAVARGRVGADTGAILLEPVQGEGGIHPARPSSSRAARALADEHGALLVLDEVQTGVGRTGTFFAFEQLRRAAGRRHAREGARERAADRRLLVADGAPAASCRATTRPRSAATPSRAPPRAPSSTTITDELLATSGAQRSQRRAESTPAFPRRAGAACCSRLDVDRPAADRRGGLPRARPPGRHGRPEHAAASRPR